VDQLRLDTITSRIREIAANDPDQRIARIAHHVCKRLARNKQGRGQGAPARSEEVPS
jgi:hypothetical protein